MAKDRIRIGIIGANRNYGFGVRAHLPALLSLPEYELTAVCTAHRETAEESARHYGAALAFHDYEAMVRHPDVDVVTVCVRVPLHYSNGYGCPERRQTRLLRMAAGSQSRGSGGDREAGEL